MRRRVKIKLAFAFGSILVVIGLWFGGAVGWGMRRLVLPVLAPRMIGSNFIIYAFNSGERFEHEKRGITLIISPSRVKEMLKGAFPAMWRVMPPGLLSHGFNVQGIWMPHGESDSSLGVIPLWIVIDRNSGYQPILKGRMPVDEVNAYLEDDMEDALSSREKWVFGSYVLIYRITFNNMRILSDTPLNNGANTRKLTLLADGKVRIKFDDKPVSASTTAKIKELRAEVNLEYVPVDEEYALTYSAKVTDLNLNVNNLLNWGDAKLADSLRRSLEKSLNRKKNKARALRLRIPEWAPRDVIIDMQLSQASGEEMPEGK